MLFSCFKRKLKNEIKVAQLSGYVAEHSAYHHGEVSLQQTIVSMAQNFVGSNNINYLLPIGQFGTRIQGGKDSASARYIFTALSPVTRTLYHEADDAVLTYLEDEGQSIEPSYYLPIIPMSLVNGAEGIGTGWSTFIPQHDPRQIIRNIRNLMAEKELEAMHPWYKGFSGTIEPVEWAGGQPSRYQVTGRYEIVEDDEEYDVQLRITELPVGKWTRDYKTFLEELAAKDDVEEIREYHEENRVGFLVSVPKLRHFEAQPGGILKKFKLTTTMSASNFVLFDQDLKLARRASAHEIMSQWFDLRTALYDRRKEYLLARLRREHEMLRNKVRFIKAVIDNELTIQRKKRKVIAATLRRLEYTTMSDLNKIQAAEKREAVVVDDQGEQADDGEER